MTLSVSSFKAGQHGRRFTTAMQVRRSDTDELIAADKVDCSAVVGKSFAESSVEIRAGTTARCSWPVPKKMRGKRIVGWEMVSYAGASVTRRFSAKIK
jgi:hypothetical protein